MANEMLGQILDNFDAFESVAFNLMLISTFNCSLLQTFHRYSLNLGPH